MHSKTLIQFVVATVHNLGVKYWCVFVWDMRTEAHIADQFGDLVLEIDKTGHHGLGAVFDILYIGMMLEGPMADASLLVYVLRPEIYVHRIFNVHWCDGDISMKETRLQNLPWWCTWPADSNPSSLVASLVISKRR